MRANVKYWLAPGIRGVELSSADYWAQRFSPHWHSGFAVGVVTREELGFCALGAEWVVGSGDLIVLDPGVVHDGYALGPDGWASRMAYIPESEFSRIAGTGVQGGGMRFHRALLHDPELANRFLAWHVLCETQTDMQAHPLTTQLFKGLGSYMSVGYAIKSFSREVNELRQRLVMLSDIGDPRVARLTNDLQLSRQATWRRARAHLGLAPKPWLKQLRLVAAKNMLVDGAPLVEVAVASGFHDQSHFTRQFTGAYGFTPGQFRKARMENKK